MADSSPALIVGRLTRAPELRFTSGNNSKAYAKFTVAKTRQAPPNGGEPVSDFFDITAWDDLAENVAESLDKGDRVVVVGEWRTDTWESNGEKKTKTVVNAHEVGPSLKFAKATVTQNERKEQKRGARPPARPRVEEVGVDEEERW